MNVRTRTSQPLLARDSELAALEAAWTEGRCQGLVIHGPGGPAPAAWAALRPSDEAGRGTGVVSTLTRITGMDTGPEGLIDHWADLHTG